MPSIGFWENQGQVIGTDGTRRPDVKFYTTGSLPQAYMRGKSKVSFAIHAVDTIIATTDTTYHLVMEPSGPYAAQVDPVGTVLKDQHLNYLLPHCGTSGVTQVPGFSRVLYENIFPFIDLHFYSGGFGQKMALVCRPGANPDHIELRFIGQDSLNQDLFGNLKFYHDGRHFVLPQAVAYQVNANNTTVPVGWNASYMTNADTALVRFSWSSYDPSKPLVFLVGPPPAMGGEITTEGVCWSTYLGGDGADRIYASDTDDEGNYYVGGFTYSQVINFPIEDGVVYYAASPITFASKFRPDHSIHWSTYYGGSSGVQWIRGLKARPSPDANIVIGGTTEANDLWTVDPLDGSYFDPGPSFGGGFLAELNTLGEAIWSTYFGNSYTTVLNLDIHRLGYTAVVGDIEVFGTLPQLQVTPPANSANWNFSGG